MSSFELRKSVVAHVIQRGEAIESIAEIAAGEKRLSPFRGEGSKSS